MIIYDTSDRRILEITVDDNSYRHRAIMGEHSLTLYYSLPEHVELPVGSYCIYQGERYELIRPSSFKMKHSRHFEYTVVMDAPQAKSKLWKFRNTVDGRLKFSLTAKPHEHLEMLVANLNRRELGWTVGDCIESAEKLINYDHDYCWDALSRMAETFETEFEFQGKRVSLRKVQYNKSNPLPLSYGRGNGFKPNVGRSNYGDTPPVEILYVQGGTDNIDPSTYGSRELHLPKLATLAYDGEHFEGQSGFNEAVARHYITDELGLSIRRSDKPMKSLAEDSVDCSTIYPKRVGEVTDVVEKVGGNDQFYDFIDTTIPPTLNYEDYLIKGETMTVIFQSGMLAGRELEVKYIHEAVKSKRARRFEIVPQEIDGEIMPNETFKPRVGDKYAIFHCSLPQAYMNAYENEGDPKEGAEWDMFREAVKKLYEIEDERFGFTGELDGLWAKKDWVNIGGKLLLGGYILFSDEHFQREGVLVRIIGIKDYINRPHSPEIELSNNTVGTGAASTLKTLTAEEVTVEDNHRSAIEFTKRRWRDAKETINLLGSALLDNFTGTINPITVETMSVLVGDESLQFRFVDDAETPSQVVHQVTYDPATKQLHAEEGILQHMTLGIKTMSSQHSPSEYKYWQMDEFTSAMLDEPTKAYYLYAKCSKSTQQGEFKLSDTAIKLEAVEGHYHFLMGVLNSEFEGERSYVSLYGFTEILPSRVTTDRVVSGDGQSYFDMVANAMKLGDVFDFNSQGDGRLRLRGTIVQSTGGDSESYIGCYRGVYQDNLTYFPADEVSYSLGGMTSTYRQINVVPCTGIPPTNSQYWQVIAQGSKGKDGVSYSGTTEFYQWSQSGTTEPTGSWTAGSIPAQPNSSYRYLWNYERIHKSDGTYTDTEKHVVGSEGKGIRSFTEYYMAYASGMMQPPANSPLWQTVIPALSVSNPYLWNKEVTVYTDNTTSTTIRLIAQRGSNGSDGNYTELRFHVSGSSTSPNCAFERDDPEPSGWTVETPTVSFGYYLWMICARKDANGNLLSDWSEPSRMTGEKGAKGDKGDKGDKGENGKTPAAVYRGEYDPDAVYYGTDYRLDIVKLGAAYYITQITAGTFSGIAPTDTNFTDKWNPFGASFESVATQLLLAEYANIAGFIFKNNVLISQKGSVNDVESSDYMNENFIPNITLDAVNGVIKQGETLTIDRAGVTIHKPNGELSAQIVDSPIGSFADLSDSNGSFTTTETVNSEGWMHHEVFIPNQTLNGKTYQLGRLSKNSRVQFNKIKVVVNVGNATQGSNSVSETFDNTRITVDLICNGHVVKTLGSSNYVSGVSSGTAISQEFNNAQTIVVDGTTYPEGSYCIQVRVVTNIYCGTNQAYWHASTTITPNVTYQKYVVKQTLIGNDGMYSCWGSNIYMYTSASGHYLRFGNYVLRVNNQGVMGSKNGGTNWTDLTM